MIAGYGGGVFGTQWPFSLVTCQYVCNNEHQVFIPPQRNVKGTHNNTPSFNESIAAIEEVMEKKFFRTTHSTAKQVCCERSADG